MTNYDEPHRNSALQMLNIADELPLFASPSISIFENPFLEESRDDETLSIAPVTPRPPLTPEYISHTVELAKGRMDLIILGGLAAMQLASEEASRHFPDPQTATSITAEQTQESQRIVRNVLDEVQGDGAQYVYTTYNLVTPDSNMLDITSSRLTGRHNIVTARVLSIVICDDYIKRTLKLEELPTSFLGDSELKISQSVEPAVDLSLRDATEFFAQNGTYSDHGIVLSIFNDELLGTGNDAITGLIDKYKNTSHLDKVLQIIDDIKFKAASRKAQSLLIKDNPSINQPSADELQEYALLLEGLRS